MSNKAAHEIDNYSDIAIEKNYIKSWKYFFHFYKKTPFRTFLICFIALIAASISVAIPFLTQAINRATTNDNLNAFIALAISIASIYVIKLILDFLNEYLGNHFNYKLEIEWRKLLIQKFYNLPMENFDNRTMGDFITRIISDLKDILNFAFQFLTNIIYVFIVLIGGFIYIFIINWLVGLIPLFVILIGILIYSLLVKKFVIVRHLAKGINARITWKTDENVQLISEIKSYTLNEAMLENYSKLQNRYLLINKKSNFQLAIFKVVGIATNLFTSALILIIASYSHLKGHINSSELLGLTSASSILVLPLTNLASLFTDIVKVSPAISRLYFWLNQKEEKRYEGLISQIKGDIEFKNVDFSYKVNGQKIEVLKDFNLKINANDFVNLYGLSGSGKSTLLKLLLRFYDVDDGVILIDGIPISKYNLTFLRSQITYVATVPKLFSETFDGGEIYIDHKKYMSIIKSLDIEEIYEKKRKIDNHVYSQGISLSEGEKQMLSIARAIYFDTKIILLDNVDSLLDEKQILKVNSYLNKLRFNKTIIVTTSHLSNNFRAAKQINI